MVRIDAREIEIKTLRDGHLEKAQQGIGGGRRVDVREIYKNRDDVDIFKI